jgi:hypothetical protein
MYDDQLDYRAIQRRAEETLKRRQFRRQIAIFAANVLIYMTFMAFIWTIYLTRDYETTFVLASLVMLSTGWSVGILLHGISVWLHSGRAQRRAREKALAAEMQREILRQGLGNFDIDSPDWKEKGKRHARLTENGEIEYDKLIDYADQDEREQR